MVKIVAPDSWRPRKSDYEGSIDKLCVKSPIEQNAYGKGGVYECLHVPKKSMTVEEYRAKVVATEKVLKGKSLEDAELIFWKNLGYSPPLYGSDVRMSLMEGCASEWNLNALDSLLRAGLKEELPGINTPFCYVGCWKSFFCWHTEDMELEAINYMHCGKPKFWYSLPPAQKGLLEREVRKFYSENATRCPEFLRHKTFIVSPYLLKERCPELRLAKVAQHPREFIVVFGASYHAGFNLGFNIAEAVNFGTGSWLRLLPRAQHCVCSKDSARIDLKAFARHVKDSPLAQPEALAFCEKVARTPEAKKKIRKDCNRWAQCDGCDAWRRIRPSYPVQAQFFCAEVGLSCRG